MFFYKCKNLFDVNVVLDLVAHAGHEAELGYEADNLGGSLVHLSAARLDRLLGLFGAVQQQRLLQIFYLNVVMLPFNISINFNQILYKLIWAYKTLLTIYQNQYQFKLN